jgi:hypothetical protein
MNRRQFLSTVAAAATPHIAGATSWQAGVATADITPDRSLWMAGFAARTQPSQGVALPLHAKALALKTANHRIAVLVTADLLGFTARITDNVAAAARRRYGIKRADLLFNASHTHCGPVVDEQLSVAYDISPTQWNDIREYTTGLESKLVALIGDAISRVAPARLAYTRDEVGFAANRRVKFPGGPVDHAVHVLRVDGADGSPHAIVFGYACHNTTLPASFVRFHGDYAGVAQAALEKRHPGAAALFVAGCGADANPAPRGTLELVEAHGTALADAVLRGLTTAASITPALRTAFDVVELPFVEAAARERWRAQLDIDPVYLQRHAALMKSMADRNGRLPATQRDPIQVWQVGDLTLVALGGEVVVDYDLRLAREYPGRRMWVAGYSNDVFAYVPSVRVLHEGGYEGGDAMIYYGRPGPFTDAVEETIVRKVRKLIG